MKARIWSSIFLQFQLKDRKKSLKMNHAGLEIFHCFFTLTKDEIHRGDTSPYSKQCSGCIQRFLRFFAPIFILILSKSFKLLLLLQRQKSCLVSAIFASQFKEYSLVVVVIVVCVNDILDVHNSADGNGREGHELKG